MKGTVLSVNISLEKGTIKTPVEHIRITETGIASDAHAGDWHRQVSLLSIESIQRFGVQAVPPLDTLHTKALVYGAKAFEPDGVVPLGPGVSLRSRVLLGLGKTPRTPALLWGLGGPAEDLSWFSLGEGLVRAGFEVDRRLAAPLALPLLMGSAAETLDLLDAYGKALSGQARPASPPPTGWNSWDYYAGAISMNDVRREMTALVQAGMTQQVRHVVQRVRDLPIVCHAPFHIVLLNPLFFGILT